MIILSSGHCILSVLVEVRLQATGDAPIMKQKNYKVDGEKRVDWIITFIRKYLKLEDSENLVSYLCKSGTTEFLGDPNFLNKASDR